MKRIRYSFILLWLANSAVLFAADRPNILFLFADDMRADTIAAHGNPHIRTPYLDSLAASGFSFRANYSFGGNSGAVCVPGRGHQPKRTPQPREAVTTGGPCRRREEKRVGSPDRMRSFLSAGKGERLGTEHYGADGDGGNTSGTNHRGAIEAAAMAGSGSPDAAQG